MPSIQRPDPVDLAEARQPEGTDRQPHLGEAEDHEQEPDSSRGPGSDDLLERTADNPSTTVFALALLPERLPIEETQSAIDGLARLGIPVQALVTNQVIPPDVVAGNTFLGARAAVQQGYLAEIDGRFEGFLRVRLPLLDRDVSDVATVRAVGGLLYGDPTAVGVAGVVAGAAGQGPATVRAGVR